MYFCRTFEAIHNKDYSVVKTSKAGAIALVLFSLFPIACCLKTKKGRQTDIPINRVTV